MRNSIILCVLALVAAAYSQSHDLYLGQIGYYDDVLYEVTESRLPVPLLERESIVIYPEKKTGNARPYITAIVARDNYRDGDGGYARVLAGGIGQDFAKIQLKSQRGHGLNFTVGIYGRRIPVVL